MSVDVILISPEHRKYQRYLPFALLYLSSFLEANGVSTGIIDLKPGSIRRRILRKEEPYLETVIDTLKRGKPLLAGLTCYTAEYGSVMETAKAIKEATGVPVVVGGVHSTLMPQDFLFKGSPVDFAIVGDGETPLLKLFQSIKLKDRNLCKNTAGIAYFDELTNKVALGGCNIESDISKFPMPDYRKIDMEFYTKPDIEHIRWLSLSGVSIFTGRGCPYNCEFCAVNFLRSLNKDSLKMRYRAVDQVIEELEFLKKEYRIDGFYVLDDCFMLEEERVREFCRKLILKRLGLIWGAETRVNLVKDEKLLVLMKKAGFIQMDFGVESGSPKMLKEINKQITVEQIKNAFELCRKNGIRTYANILYNIPDETEEDIRLTNKLLDEIKPTVAGCGTTVPLLGSRLYEKYVLPRLTPREYQLYNLNVYENIVDARFKLAKHNLNFTGIVRKLNDKYLNPGYSNFRLPSAVPFNPGYWKKIITSRRLRQYMLVYLKMLLLAPIIGIPFIFRHLVVLRGALAGIIKAIYKKKGYGYGIGY